MLKSLRSKANVKRFIKAVSNKSSSNVHILLLTSMRLHTNFILFQIKENSSRIPAFTGDTVSTDILEVSFATSTSDFISSLNENLQIVFKSMSMMQWKMDCCVCISGKTKNAFQLSTKQLLHAAS